MIEQAFGEISLPGNLTLDFGKFTTTAGAEVIEANKNWLYSRSLLFNAIPLLHTGVRANLKINDMVTVQAQRGQRLEQRPRSQRLEDDRPVGDRSPPPRRSRIIATTYFGKEGQPQPARPAARRATSASWLDIVAAYTVNATSAST